ncbi:PREDICTED: uncharacterized protein LOC109580234 [Amphimedon queenslandica]|uniref:Uncharacterized protein n=1 Tax=Amphimedon queenslandica TaxID=400682 RepID=A0A1X7VHI2_AMPQE|nr:PREDICTED: uncharacterized protein LOC109580234 [Amphimedon queenslandica]|eukprot:XP_019848751.1 PREDICTED: uncharacterized protein LOC109580234 [Amphimedon queenslandica]
MAAEPQEYEGIRGQSILEFDDARKKNPKKPAKPTREDVRELLETKIFIFNFSFNAVGSNKGLSEEVKQTIPYKAIADILYTNYGLYKIQSGEERDYSLTPQTYVAYIKETREKGIAAAKKIIVDAKKTIMGNYSDKVAEVHIIASLAIVYDDQHRPSKTITIRN